MAQTGGGLTAPVGGTLDGDEFSGLLQVTQFFNQGGVLSVVGNILDGLGNVVSGFTATVTDVQGSCEILDLTIGAIDLDLLGLVITISPTSSYHAACMAGAGAWGVSAGRSSAH